ncbi:MAG: HAD-IA family hydrolase [Candidatus Woesearchaeota archaeon]
MMIKENIKNNKNRIIPKAIIFDLWDTIGTKNIGISKTLFNYFNIEKTPELMIQYESSIQVDNWSTEEEMASNFLKTFNLPTTSENIYFVTKTLDYGISKATLYPGMETLLQELKLEYKLGLLSNTTIFESGIIDRWNIEKLFDSRVYSWQIASLKPAKLNFDIICTNLKVLSSECIFIDDNKKNVELARSYGFTAIKYENIDQLRSELKNLGIMLN